MNKTRLKALQLAIDTVEHVNRDADIVETAQKFTDFLEGGAPKDTSAGETEIVNIVSEAAGPHVLTEDDMLFEAPVKAFGTIDYSETADSPELGDGTYLNKLTNGDA